MNKRKFIAHIGNNNTIKIFVSETGQLFRVLTIQGKVTTPPVCTDTELTVGVKTPTGDQMLTYSIPSFSLKKTVTL